MKGGSVFFLSPREYKNNKKKDHQEAQEGKVDDVEMRKVGIRLTVTPHIITNKYVLMDIVQKVENIAGSQPINDVKWPIVASRELSAQVAVSSGETIVLGGLVLDRGEKSKTKVPILGDIPLVGTLFRSASKEKQQSEVVVFITPTVLNTPQEIAADARKRFNVMRGEGMTLTKDITDSKVIRPAKAPAPRPTENPSSPDSSEDKKPGPAEQTPDIVPEFSTGPELTDDIDPEILKLIARHEERLGKSVKKAEERLDRELKESQQVPE